MGVDPGSLQRLLGDRYEVIEEVGSGGMAAVWRARDLKLGRDVAVKILHPELSSAVGVERFRREIAVASTLQHPNIVPLFDSGGEDTMLFYIMPFVAGETLRARLRREPQLPVDDVRRIARDVAEALGHAHAHGIVHRDVKPENVLLSDGRALVADFGIARVLDRAADEITSLGIIVGTPAYMSPEQAAGGTAVDGRTDLYALGCVVYEMLAGEPPFGGATPQAVLARQVHEHPPSLRMLRPSLTGELERVVERSLAKSPADRFATAQAFADALDRAVTLGEVSAPPRPGRRAWRATGLLAVAALAGAAVYFGRPRATDANTLMVYPLEAPGSDPAEGIGEQVALMIGSALEHTEPLRWLDGRDVVEGAGRLTDESAMRAARRAGARYGLTGAVVRNADSLVVIVRLLDAMGDSLVRQESASGRQSATSAPQLALRAVSRILPTLLPASGRIDLTYLSERSTAAVADWLQGEREYARSAFVPALAHLQRAVGRDSAMGVAALKGAQAAAHLEDYAAAKVLLGIVRRHDAQLPRHHAALLRGLEHYVAGQADSAVGAFTEARRADSTWNEPEMWLGETYYHLLPTAADPDSLAERGFRAAVRRTPTFAPALFHLTEIAALRGDHTGAREYLQRFASVSPDSDWTFQAELTVRCARDGPERVDWRAAVDRAPDRVVNMARLLGSGGRYPACGLRAARAVLDHDTASAPMHRIYRWSALKGLTYQLIATGATAAVPPLLDSAGRHGEPAAVSLHVLAAAAGVRESEAAADAAMRGLMSVPVDRMTATRLRYTTLWSWHRRDLPRLDSLERRARVFADSSGLPADRVVYQGAAARHALVRGDTASALRWLRAVRPRAEVGPLTWDLWESAAQERLLLAELQLATGDLAGALATAELFDSPRAQVHLLYLPRSLDVRVHAASRSGESTLTDRYRAQQRALRGGS